MSLQVQPLPQQQLPQQQQPVQVYPTTVTEQPPSHHSNGSFGTVFVVLAIIVVISAVACCLGRLCNRRYHNHNHNYKHDKQQKHQKQQNHNYRQKESDIEFGFDKRIAAAKPNGYGAAGRVPPKPMKLPGNGDGRVFEMKLGNEGELRAGA